jgi:hypothetical protein
MAKLAAGSTYLGSYRHRAGCEGRTPSLQSIIERHGKAGHAKVLVVHASAALQHANAAEKADDNPHTKEGITHLNASIAEGKKGHARSATGHAEEALTHLKAVTK